MPWILPPQSLQKLTRLFRRLELHRLQTGNRQRFDAVHFMNRCQQRLLQAARVQAIRNAQAQQAAQPGQPAPQPGQPAPAPAPQPEPR